MSDQVAEMSATYLVEAGPDAVPVGYKQTQVGVIPEDWQIYPLSQLINTTQIGGNYKNSENDTGQPLIKMGNIGRGFISLKKQEFITEKSSDTDLLKHGDLLLNTRNTLELVGKVAIWRNELPAAYFNSNLMRITFSKKYVASNFYMNAFMNSKRFINALSDIAIGTTSVAAIYTRDLFQIKITLPSKKEQTAIANALSDVDALISELEKLIAKKQAIKTATMQQLLTGRTRLPQFALREDGTPKGYKQSELGEIPEDWETVPFRNLLSIRHGKNQKIVEEENGNYPIFATGGRIGWANSYLWDKPSVLIGRKGTINKPRYADKPFWTVDTLFYSEISPHADAKFIYFKFCMVDWMQYNEASGVPSLSTNTIESILTTAPVKEEQTAIANVLSDMDKEIQALEQRLGKTRQIKQGMMQELLTGKTRLVAPLSRGENHAS